MKNTLAILMLIIAALPVHADVSYELAQLKGWTIVDVKSIEGHQEPGDSKQSGFEGCNGDTNIFFMDGTVAKCMSLGLDLELMPKALIFGQKTTYQAQCSSRGKALAESRESAFGTPSCSGRLLAPSHSTSATRRCGIL